MGQKFDLTEKQVAEIQKLNSKLTILRNMMSDSSLSDRALNAVIDRITDAQLEYDEWFSKIELELNVKTLPTNNWNVNFTEAYIELI